MQESAHPYHDWNERVTAECYAPNTASRILDPDGKIVRMVNNYEKISFNFGPTLLSWMEKRQPDIYEAILKADEVSRERFSGHGSALAQAYNHIIMPLANRRDKYTQALWGVRDFQRRFGRFPEGMWLPETAVDLETLEVLAESDISFTILGPRQARRVRPLGEREWLDVSGGGVDTSMPYICRLPSGRSISLFFYDGPTSWEVAFGGLLENGESFAHRLLNATPDGGDPPQLVHIATDGETYGHHRPMGDMALAYCLYFIETHRLAEVTVYGEFLEKRPPTHEVEIAENSSWSCAHGVERWRDNCGCSNGSHAEWTQTWRRPLRDAMDWLRDTVNPLYERETARLLKDPWEVRNDYIQVILDCSEENVKDFIARHSLRSLSSREETRVLKLLEMQRHCMLMYTSCGWFFDEISRIETAQVMKYAARVMELAEEVLGIWLKSGYMEILEGAPANVRGLKNGAEVYESCVKRARGDVFKDERHAVLEAILRKARQELEVPFRQTVEDYCASMDSVKDGLRPLPKHLSPLAQLILNGALFEALEQEELDMNALRSLGDEVKNLSVELDVETLGFKAGGRIGELVAKVAETPEDIWKFERIEHLIQFLMELGLHLNLWKAQNIFFDLVKEAAPAMQARAENGDPSAAKLMEVFRSLGDHLHVKLP